MLKPHQRMYLCAFLMDCAIMMGFTVVPFFVMRQLGGGARMVGTIAALQSISHAAGSLISSPFVARAKNGLHWALAGIAGYAFLFCLAHMLCHAYLYVALTMLGCAFMGLLWPALWAWMGGEPDVKVRTKRISHYNICWSLGLSVGPLFSAPLYRVDYRLPFVAVFALAAVVWFLVLSLPHEKHYYVAVPETEEQQGERAAYNRASQNHLYCAWFANLLGWMLVGAARSVFAKRVDQLAADGLLSAFPRDILANVSLTDAVLCFSWLVFTINFSRVVVFFLMGRTHRWQHQFGVLAAFQIAAGAAVWGLGTTQSLAVMVLCCSAIGMNCGVGFFTAVAYSLASPARKHQRAAINEGMVGGGSFIGSMGFGLLAGWFGVTMPFRWGPLFVAAGILIEWGLLRYGIRKNRPSP